MATIKAHFDGKVFVPDEPVDLPKDQPVVVQPDPAAPRQYKKRWLGRFPGQIKMAEDFDAPLEEFKDYM